MSFGEQRDRHPALLCRCGHPADRHLYCGDHFCVMPHCPCGGFVPLDRELWMAEPLMAATGPAVAPQNGHN